MYGGDRSQTYDQLLAVVWTGAVGCEWETGLVVVVVLVVEVASASRELAWVLFSILQSSLSSARSGTRSRPFFRLSPRQITAWRSWRLASKNFGAATNARTQCLGCSFNYAARRPQYSRVCSHRSARTQECRTVGIHSSTQMSLVTFSGGGGGGCGLAG